MSNKNLDHIYRPRLFFLLSAWSYILSIEDNRQFAFVIFIIDKIGLYIGQ